jgi:predicted nucleic acid-binding protein
MSEALNIYVLDTSAWLTLIEDEAGIAALAKERDATLIHKDPEFEQVEELVQVLKLPYKSAVR